MNTAEQELKNSHPTEVIKMNKEELEENMLGYCGGMKEFIRKGDFKSALMLLGNFRKFILSYSKEIKSISTSQEVKEHNSS